MLKNGESVSPCSFLCLLKKKQDNALSEIKFIQKQVALLIPRLPFSRLVHEIAHNHRNGLRMRSIALAALQEASETLLTMWFQMLYIFALINRY